MKRSRLTRALPTAPNDLDLAALLASMPTAQAAGPDDALGSLRRSALTTHGAAYGALGATTPSLGGNRSPRIRFVYIVEHTTSESVDAYHDLLVEAEVLLDRLFNAQAIGLRPLDLQLGAHHLRQIFARPPRGVFTSISPEYRRWYNEHGSTRVIPLTREALIAELCRLDGLAAESAREAATHRSWALPRASQEWLIARAEVEVMHRPLHRDDMDGLARTLEAILGRHALPSRTERIVETNRKIAVRTAAAVGSLLDTFAPPPFAAPELAEAFVVAHAAHLARIASVATLRPATNSAIHWFLAKRHQIKAMVARQTHRQISGAHGHPATVQALPAAAPSEAATSLVQPGYTDWFIGEEALAPGEHHAPNR